MARYRVDTVSEDESEEEDIMKMLQKDLEDLKTTLGGDEKDSSFDELLARAKERNTPMKTAASESFERIQSPLHTPAFKMLSPVPGVSSTPAAASRTTTTSTEIELMQKIIDNQASHIETLKRENEYLRSRLETYEGPTSGSPGSKFVANLSKKVGIDPYYQQQLSDIMDDEFERYGR